jgi:hypothetical protein
MVRRVALVVLLALLLAACGGGSSELREKLTGTWHDPNVPDHTMSFHFKDNELVMEGTSPVIPKAVMTFEVLSETSDTVRLKTEDTGDAGWTLRLNPDDTIYFTMDGAPAPFILTRQ